jgi:hypothetical protein
LEEHSSSANKKGIVMIKEPMPPKQGKSEPTPSERGAKIKAIWRKLFGEDMPEGGSAGEPSNKMSPRREPKILPSPDKPMFWKDEKGQRWWRNKDGSIQKDPMPYI